VWPFLQSHEASPEISACLLHSQGLHEEYKFGQELTAEDRAKLVSIPVDEHAMHMIMDELKTTHLFPAIRRMGMVITIEEAARAIAHQIEMNEVRDSLIELEDEMKSEGMQMPYKNVRQLSTALSNRRLLKKSIIQHSL
jgi:hypothetical protein